MSKHAPHYHEMSFAERQEVLHQSEVLRARVAARMLTGLAHAIGGFFSHRMDRTSHAHRLASERKYPASIL